MSGRDAPVGHAFISYVHEDSDRVDELQRTLEAAGVTVWRDTADLWPGEDWRANIRRAITSNALVFLACFSRLGLSRSKSYQNEELTLAIEQLRMRRPEDAWLIPVRFDDCEIPDLDIGGGRTLTSLQRVDLFGDQAEAGAGRLVSVILRILRRRDSGPPARPPSSPAVGYSPSVKISPISEIIGRKFPPSAQTQPVKKEALADQDAAQEHNIETITRSADARPSGQPEGSPITQTSQGSLEHSALPKNVHDDANDAMPTDVAKSTVPATRTQTGQNMYGYRQRRQPMESQAARVRSPYARPTVAQQPGPEYQSPVLRQAPPRPPEPGEPDYFIYRYGAVIFIAVILLIVLWLIAET